LKRLYYGELYDLHSSPNTIKWSNHEEWDGWGMWHVQSYKYRNICVLLNSQAALNNFWINSRLVCDCYQSLVEWAEHNG
jgi:hypothetical protein